MSEQAEGDFLRLASLLDKLASLVERMADTTPDGRDRVRARAVAIEAGEFYVEISGRAQ